MRPARCLGSLRCLGSAGSVLSDLRWTRTRLGMVGRPRPLEEDSSRRWVQIVLMAGLRCVWDAHLFPERKVVCFLALKARFCSLRCRWVGGCISARSRSIGLGRLFLGVGMGRVLGRRSVMRGLLGSRGPGGRHRCSGLGKWNLWKGEQRTRAGLLLPL